MNDPNDYPPWGTPVSVDDPEALGRLSQRLAEWEPRLLLHRPPTDSLIYVPDGTLYAINLAAGADYQSPRGVRHVALGDALVIPREVSVDAGPEVDLIGVIHDGPPPDHFRERFIQVFGYEHFPAADLDPTEPAFVEVIPGSDPRHRLSYATAAVSPGMALTFEGRHPVLLVALTGEFSVSLDDPRGGRVNPLPTRSIQVLWPGTQARITGSGRIGSVALPDEETHWAARREGKAGGLTHEAGLGDAADTVTSQSRYLPDAGLSLVDSTPSA